jgi:hypothetical protein
MQTIEEILFAFRKTKEKKCSKQLTKYPFKLLSHLGLTVANNLLPLLLTERWPITAHKPPSRISGVEISMCYPTDSNTCISTCVDSSCQRVSK